MRKLSPRTSREQVIPLRGRLRGEERQLHPWLVRIIEVIQYWKGKSIAFRHHRHPVFLETPKDGASKGGTVKASLFVYHYSARRL